MKSVSVFQDLDLKGPAHTREKLVELLEALKTDRWHYDTVATEEISESGFESEGLMAFTGTSSEGRLVRLVLWPRGEGYYVPNVVPIATGSLTIDEYNAILTDFGETILGLAESIGWSIETTGTSQGPKDWMSEAAVAKLRGFSRLANKSTGSGHPMDQGRWFDFIIEVQSSGNRPDGGLLQRWLEAEGFPETTAMDLAIEFENGIALLDRAGRTRGL